MLFAGLYDSATLDGALCCFCVLPCDRLMRCAGQSEPLWTFTIVTTEASSDYAWLHDRQPVILTSQDALDRWLDTSTQNWDPKLSRLLDPYTDSDFPLEWCAYESYRPLLCVDTLRTAMRSRKKSAELASSHRRSLSQSRNAKTASRRCSRARRRRAAPPRKRHRKTTPALLRVENESASRRCLLTRSRKSPRRSPAVVSRWSP
jgi:hypothetical protein